MPFVRVWPGSPWPLGATWDGTGVNFAIFSEHATKVELCLFDSPDAVVGRICIPLIDRTDRVWHAYLPDVRPGQLYGYRLHGPWDPARGQRFNPAKVVLDPYARAIGRPMRWHPSLFAFEPGSGGDGPPELTDSAPYAPLGAVIDDAFTWGSDRPPRTAWSETVIYELHVKGFTALNESIPPHLRGTYLGLASEPAIRHLTTLGVTAVELMPIHAHADEYTLHAAGRTNYWGYNSLSYFAPDARFSTAPSPLDVVREVKMMVRALHAAGLEVILDVVYNHTAEGNHLGPTLSLRGIDNRTYYRLDPNNLARYQDFTGTGNTLNMQSANVLQLMMDSLRYWVQDVHVDGFRFDLASALARELYAVDRLSAFFDVIAQDPVISRVKLIAEPWDVGEGGYQVGNFPPGWAEWNGHYRDTVRRFWRGDEGVLPELATRVSGSSDLYGSSGRQPHASINFITSHDGFTLADLVSYEQKHNEANGEDNRDGDNNNLSWNGGVEGPTDDASILALRRRQQRNFLLTLFVSIGVPMIAGGDEMGRSQQGNNNAYTIDSPDSWTPWTLDDNGRTLAAFARALVALRRSQPVLRRRTFLNGRRAGAADVLWLQPDGTEMTGDAWNDRSRRALGVLLDGEAIAERGAHGERITGDTLLILLNAGPNDVAFTLPAHRIAVGWDLLIDTATARQKDERVPVAGHWTVVAHSAAVFREAR
jgi:glycogen operon protein